MTPDGQAPGQHCLRYQMESLHGYAVTFLCDLSRYIAGNSSLQVPNERRNSPKYVHMRRAIQLWTFWRPFRRRLTMSGKRTRSNEIAEHRMSCPVMNGVLGRLDERISCS